METVATPWRSFKITDSEKAWLRDHSKIRIGIMNAWPPMNFVDGAGLPKGIGVDFLEAINERLGGILTVEPGSFEENFDRCEKQTTRCSDGHHPIQRASVLF